SRRSASDLDDRPSFARGRVHRADDPYSGQYAMSAAADTSAHAPLPERAGGFWRRVGAMLMKEFIQLRRDRITFGPMISIPLLQLVLFGYAINTTPRDLPTAVLLQERSDVGRSILAALRNTKYFKLVRQANNVAELDGLLASGQVLFAV